MVRTGTSTLHLITQVWEEIRVPELVHAGHAGLVPTGGGRSHAGFCEVLLSYNTDRTGEMEGER